MIKVENHCLLSVISVLGMDAALQYINKTRLHQKQQITINDILEIHKRVLGFVNLEEAGRFRQTQVSYGERALCDCYGANLFYHTREEPRLAGPNGILIMTAAKKLSLCDC